MKAKKVLALLLASAMSLSLLAGCGGGSSEAGGNGGTGGSEGSSGSEEGGASSGENGEEPYTVAIQVVTLPGSEFSGQEEREAAINAITEPAINCKVDIQEVWISEVANTTSMAVAGGEKVDIIHVGTVTPLSAMVSTDILLDMNEGNLLQEKGPQLQALFGDLLAVGNVSGKQLAIPAKVFNANGKGIAYNKTVADEINLTIPEKITREELEDILTKVHEAKPDMFPYFAGAGDGTNLSWVYNYESFGSNAAYGAILDPENGTKIENLFSSDIFKEYCLDMQRWRQNGLQPGDPTDTNTTQDYFKAQKLFCSYVGIRPSEEVSWGSIAAEGNFEVGFAALVDPMITNSAVTEYMWGIAANSERPDKAIEFLNFLYSNAEVANILQYGLEGTNYEFVEGSEKVIKNNGSYIPMFYCGGNSAEMYIASPAEEDYVERNQTLEAEAKVSPFCAYMFDDSAFQAEAAVLSSTITEYLPRLMCGMCESEEATLDLINEFNEKLAASGIDDVIRANQEQLDAFLAQ